METLVADLFCGCGGLSYGLQEAGIPISLGMDNWTIAVQNYNHNFEHICINEDLSNESKIVSILQDAGINFIVGGPPCQDFSQAGKREELDRASLTESFAKIISAVKPVGFLMENVDRAQKSQAYTKARKILKESGYGLTEIVLDASLCGVPQKRKRFFVFGILGEDDGFWESAFKSHLSSKPMTLKDYFGESLGFEYYYRHPRNYSRRAVFSIYEPAPTMRGVNRPIPKGYKGHPGDPVPISQVSHALTTQDRAKIQTFPDSYDWIGSKTDVEQMIGNAVPCGLAKYVGERIKEYFDSRGKTMGIQTVFGNHIDIREKGDIRYCKPSAQGKLDFGDGWE
ncbi:DNA cytosine methyltransferase [uncultured Dubosiella sp.]|uniref:DNA cytosine methyltransferase n=1 Tax=uncultured Dubosiella sp. TaxID=1937011 RepID=UPI002624F883|nr:DNA (cytosine-5-)-methyltransferase [uncultured Dubosiella sp.]